MRDLLPGAIAIGLGIVITQVSITITATSGISDDEQGLVPGLLTTFQQIGSGLGVGMLVAVAAIRTKGVMVTASVAQASAAALTAGYRAALLTGAGFALVGVSVSLWVLRKENPHAQS